KEEKDMWLSKGKGMRMDTYSHLVFYTAWPDTGALMRRLDDGKGSKEGKPGNMYQHLGSTEEERQQNLKLFKDWVGGWTLKRWKDITKEDMDGIKAKY
ncbi:MAG: cytochrome C, partial [Nitrospirota bacterium]